MYNMTLQTAAAQLETPWRNGLGTTIELAKYPPDAALNQLDFLWRLSIATIKEPGPFSNFPGYWRSITLLSGAEPTLIHEINDRETRLQLHRLMPHSFAGEWPTRTELTSAEQAQQPCRDFNVITRQRQMESVTEVITTSKILQKSRTLAGDWQAFYLDTGTAQLQIGDRQLQLQAQDFLLLERQMPNTTITCSLQLTPASQASDATLLLVTLRRQ